MQRNVSFLTQLQVRCKILKPYTDTMNNRQHYYNMENPVAWMLVATIAAVVAVGAMLFVFVQFIDVAAEEYNLNNNKQLK